MQQQRPYEVLLKILLLGDTGSQKTELLQKYMGEVPGMEDSIGPTLGARKRERERDHVMIVNMTLGLDYRLKDVLHNGKAVKLQLW